MNGVIARVRRGRRILATLGVTGAGLGLLFSYRSHADVVGALSARARAIPATAGERSATGTAEYTPNGPVAVEIFSVGNRITEVEALSLPNDNAHSIELSNYSGPRLRAQALRAQSAAIDGVSGATMTSTAFKLSLQSAIARLHATAHETITGSLVRTEFGPVQVELTVESGRIARVTALRLPGNSALAVSLSDYAAPILARQALGTERGRIDGVSGATVTSDAYRKSLQSALDAFGKQG